MTGGESRPRRRGSGDIGSRTRDETSENENPRPSASPGNRDWSGGKFRGYEDSTPGNLNARHTVDIGELPLFQGLVVRHIKR